MEEVIKVQKKLFNEILAENKQLKKMNKLNDVSLNELRTECGKHGYELSYTSKNVITGIHQFTIETVEVAISNEDTRITVYDEYGNGHAVGSYYLTVDEAVEAWKEQMKGEKK